MKQQYCLSELVNHYKENGSVEGYSESLCDILESYELCHSLLRGIITSLPTSSKLHPTKIESEIRKAMGYSTDDFALIMTVKDGRVFVSYSTGQDLGETDTSRIVVHKADVREKGIHQVVLDCLYSECYRRMFESEFIERMSIPSWMSVGHICEIVDETIQVLELQWFKQEMQKIILGNSIPSDCKEYFPFRMTVRGWDLDSGYRVFNCRSHQWDESCIIMPSCVYDESGNSDAQCRIDSIEKLIVAVESSLRVFNQDKVELMDWLCSTRFIYTDGLSFIIGLDKYIIKTQSIYDERLYQLCIKYNK